MREKQNRWDAIFEINTIFRLVVCLLIVLCVVLVNSFWLVNIETGTEAYASASAQPKLSNKSCKLVIGDVSQIKVKNVGKSAIITYKSNKKKVAKVSKEGKVAALTAGVTKITVTVKENGKTTNLKYMVTVRKPIPKKKKIEINVGDKVPIDIKYLPKNTTSYTVDLVSSKGNVVGSVAGYDDIDNISGLNAEMVENEGMKAIFEGKGVGTAKLNIKIHANGKTYSVALKISVKANDYKDILSQIKQTNVHDIVTFGEYEQDNISTNGKEPIEWIVLSKNDSEATLLSKYSLDCKAFNDKRDDTTWYNSSLRSWLNNEFSNEAFSETEKKYIKKTILEDGNHSVLCEDEVTLLSKENITTISTEFENAVSFDEIMLCEPTAYAVEQGVMRFYSSSNGSDYKPCCTWILRSTGIDGLYGLHVDIFEGHNASSTYLDHKLGVRPVIHVNLDPTIDEKGGYLSEKYSGLYTLAQRGIIGINTEKHRDEIVLGKWDMEYPDSNIISGDGLDDEIEWEVLEYSSDGKKALIISKNILFSMPYNDTKEDTAWEKCTLREWLNTEFYSKAFSDKEKKVIIETNNITEDYEDGKGGIPVDGGNDTLDKIFILSKSEFERYYDGYTQDHRVGIGSYSDGEAGAWWLRTPGFLARLTSGVSESGFVGNYDVDESGSSLNYTRKTNLGGVRPVLWVDLDSNILETKKYDLLTDDKVDSLDELYITIGSYHLSGDKQEKIQWKILEYDEKNGRALLLSKYNMDYKGLNDTYVEGLSWKDCSLRQWLNGMFFDSAFSDSEKKIIQKVNLENDDSKTDDKVFLLSLSEVDMYLGSDRDAPMSGRIGSPWIGLIMQYYNAEWWLRSWGSGRTRYDKDGFAYIDDEGHVMDSGTGARTGFGIRPAMWISIK